MDKLEDFQVNWTNMSFTTMEAEGKGLDLVMLAQVPQ